MMTTIKLFIILLIINLSNRLAAQNCKVEPVSTFEWTSQRKAILKFYRDSVYGKIPNIIKPYKVILQHQNNNWGNGLAVRKQYQLIFKKDTVIRNVYVLMLIPKKTLKTSVVISLNFFGNHCIDTDTTIFLNPHWMAWHNEYGTQNFKASEQSRGIHSRRFPLEYIIKEGYGFVTAYYGDFAPDNSSLYESGLYAVSSDKNITTGAISLWAWSYGLLTDFANSEKKFKNAPIILVGHSRQGKAALWASVHQKNIVGVVSNNSGCMGAALSKCKTGESSEDIYKKFSHWFIPNFAIFRNPELLPYDQHHLLACVAPKKLYVCSASEDFAACPESEFKALTLAQPIFEKYASTKLATLLYPSVNHVSQNKSIAYHLREGKHDLLLWDWERFLAFFKEK